MRVGHSGPGCRRWGRIPAALGFRLDVVASEFRPWKGILLGRSLPLPGCVFEQQGEEAAQPILRVGGGPGDDPDHPELGGVLFGHSSPVLSALFLHISLRRAGVSTRPAVTAGLPAAESEGSWGGTPCRIWEVTRESSLLGHGRKWAGCGVILVYRDLRQFPKYKSGAVLNLKVARKEGSRGRLSEQFVNGLVPKNGTQLQKGKSGVGATSERAIGRGGWNRGCATPYGTALYRTWGQGNQPSGLSPGSAKGPSDGRWNSHVFASSSGRLSPIESGESKRA